MPRPVRDIVQEDTAMQEHNTQRRREAGFTLIELLITIVVVGVLTVVAIIGVGGLLDDGHVAACRSSMDAAKGASTVHYANTGTYPQSFLAMTSTNPQEFEVPAGVTQTLTTLKKGTSWTLTLTPNGAANQTTYACS